MSVPARQMMTALNCVSADAEEMDTMQEFISFAKEMWNQKHGRGMVKIYVLGSVFALLGTVIGLVETVSRPFSSGPSLDAEMVLMMAREHRTVKAETQKEGDKEEEEEEKKKEELARKDEAISTQSLTFSKSPRLFQRSMATRPHAP